MATEVTEYAWDLDDDGRTRFQAVPAPVPHRNDDCRRFATLKTEEWPAMSR